MPIDSVRSPDLPITRSALAECPSDRWRNYTELGHELDKLLGIERLRTIRERLVRTVMHLNQQAVRSSSNGSASHGRHLIAAARAMRGIGHNRQMRKLFHDRNSRNIQGIAGISFKGADSTLAHNHFIIATRHQVFGGEQQLFNGGGNSTFEKDRLAYLTQFTQQIEVLHVARPYLEDIHVRQHKRNLRYLHDLAHHQQPKLVRRLTHEFERILAHPLKGVR